MIFDQQDRHNHSRFIYRQPLDLGEDAQRASILLVEGLDDSLVPNHSNGISRLGLRADPSFATCAAACALSFARIREGKCKCR